MNPQELKKALDKELALNTVLKHELTFFRGMVADSLVDSGMASDAFQDIIKATTLGEARAIAQRYLRDVDGEDAVED